MSVLSLHSVKVKAKLGKGEKVVVVVVVSAITGVSARRQDDGPLAKIQSSAFSSMGLTVYIYACCQQDQSIIP